MEYLNNIQCKSEPFSSTAGDDRFISQSVREALEKLTHSVRLGAGLHTVVGPANTGKTTLLEKLSENFSKETRTAVITINNPKYNNLQQFLLDIAGVFRPVKKVSGVDNRKIQEAFNTFVHKQCQENKIRILLLIDNGHDLPDFCLQGLDDFYGYQTNCRLMLQTVICGEPALQKNIKSVYGADSRVTLSINLKSFSFKDTRELIRFHLGRAAVDPDSPPVLFSTLSQWAIHHITMGSPRQIIDLCHMIVITMAIENRKKADWFLALRCANLLNPKRAKKLQLARVGSLSSLVLLMLVFGLWSEKLTTDMVPEPARTPVAQKVVQPEPQPGKATIPEEAVRHETAAPPTPVAEQAKDMAPTEDKIAAIIEEAARPEPDTAPETAAPPQVVTIIEEAIRHETVVPKTPVAEEPAAPAADKIAVIDLQEKPVVETVAAEDFTPKPAREILQVISPAIRERREVMPGDTFLVMIQKVYGPGHLKPHFINQVLNANPHLQNPDSLTVGDDVFFPVLTAEDKVPVAPVSEEKIAAVVSGAGPLVSRKLERGLLPADSPNLIGKLIVQPGETLGKLIRGVYGPFSFNPDYTGKVLAVNTHLKNPDSLEVGDTVYFPDLPITPEIGLPAKPDPVLSRGEIPEFLGEIAAFEDETFGDMIRKIYGPYSFNAANAAKVLKANPGLNDPGMLSVGQKIRFPTILVALTPKAEEVWWVKIVSHDTLQNAYRFLRVFSTWAPPMLIIPSRNDSGQVIFNILLQNYFADELSAQKAINELPDSISINAKTLHGLDSNTYYYWTK